MAAKRADTVSRIIAAPPRTLYHAFLDREAVASWRPPAGMKCEIYSFDPREGGSFRMRFSYTETDHSLPGKTSEHSDVFRGRFLELVPAERIVEMVEFESGNPSFAGPMTVITTFTAVLEGTRVTIRCENVPEGISAADHEAGIGSTLANLTAFAERRAHRP